MKNTFLAKSSTGGYYAIEVEIKNDQISMVCSCGAGRQKQLCKHVLCFFAGDSSILFDAAQTEAFETFYIDLTKSNLTELFKSYEAELISIDNQKKELDKQKLQIKGMFGRKLQEGV